MSFNRRCGQKLWHALMDPRCRMRSEWRVTHAAILAFVLVLVAGNVLQGAQALGSLRWREAPADTAQPHAPVFANFDGASGDAISEVQVALDAALPAAPLVQPVARCCTRITPHVVSRGVRLVFFRLYSRPPPAGSMGI
jgi:hypothetical protein